MITAITSVWTSILTWITSSMSSIQNVFYNSTDGELTFLGVLAVIGVAIGICLLVFNKVRDFLRLS